MLYVILGLLVVVCVWFVLGDVKYKSQYKKYQNILGALKNAGFETREQTSNRKEAESDIIINGQCVGALYVSKEFYPRRRAEYMRDKAVEQIGEAAATDVFFTGYCDYGTLAYWSVLPNYLTREMINDSMANMRSGSEETAAWIKGSSEAEGIVSKFMR